MLSANTIRHLLSLACFCTAGALCAAAQSTDNAQEQTATVQHTTANAQDTAARENVPQDTAGPDATATQAPAKLFANASAAYEAGDFATAAALFAQLSADAPSLAAYYNLGNAYFRLGQYGHAIAAYEKAHALAPAQPEVRANLDRAREAARIAPLPVGRWEDYARKLSPNAWTLALAVSFWAALALWLIPAQFRRPYGIWRPALLTLAVVVLLLSIAGLYPWRQMSRTGTVLEPDTPLLLAPVATSPVQGYAQAGQSAQLIGSHGAFDRIRLPDGTTGWIARTQFSTIWNLSR